MKAYHSETGKWFVFYLGFTADRIADASSVNEAFFFGQLLPTASFARLYRTGDTWPEVTLEGQEARARSAMQNVRDKNKRIAELEVALQAANLEVTRLRTRVDKLFGQACESEQAAENEKARAEKLEKILDDVRERVRARQAVSRAYEMPPSRPFYRSVLDELAEKLS